MAVNGTGAGLFVDAVVEDQERQPEHPEGVFGLQLAGDGVDVQLLGEAGDGEGGHVPGVGVDGGQVVARVGQVAPGGEGQPAVNRPRGRRVAAKVAWGSGKPMLT